MKEKGKKANKIPELDSDEMLLKLGKRIKSLRLQKGYKSYETFAYEKGISRAQFGRYENGQDIRFSSLIRVLNALEISLEEFFSDGFK